MLAVKARYESLIREFANLDLCNKWSCYHCFKRACPVREDAKQKVAEYMTKSGAESTNNEGSK